MGSASRGEPAERGSVTAAVAPSLLTVSDISNRLRLRPAAVRLLARQGAIGYYRVGRSLRFTEGDLAAFLEGCRRPMRGEKAMRRLL